MYAGTVCVVVTDVRLAPTQFFGHTWRYSIHVYSWCPSCRLNVAGLGFLYMYALRDYRLRQEVSVSGCVQAFHEGVVQGH